VRDGREGGRRRDEPAIPGPEQAAVAVPVQLAGSETSFARAMKASIVLPISGGLVQSPCPVASRREEFSFWLNTTKGTLANLLAMVTLTTKKPERRGDLDEERGESRKGRRSRWRRRRRTPNRGQWE
jgi:hypothetical protein